MPVIDTESNLWNMKTFLASVIIIGNEEGHFVDDMKPYGILLNAMLCNEGWFAIGEVNKEGVFHVHCMARTGVRSDSWRRTIKTTWDTIHKHPSFQSEYGLCTLECLKIQKAHKPTALMAYMCKNPTWVLADNEMYLQMAYDIDLWKLWTRFDKSKKEDEGIDEANPMIKQLLETIREFNIKTFEDFLRLAPQVAIKYLHRPAFQTIVQNCIMYAKQTGSTWSLANFAKYNPDPAAIHAILLTQGISPTDWDHTFWEWITKRHPKKNTICITGPSNTGKTSLLSGFIKVCPGGEVVNAQNFNFEGLVDAFWGRWDEPLCGPEQAEKFKQIAGGEPCAVPVKFKKPVVLPRIPMYICCNREFWYWCPQNETMFRNRFFMYHFGYDVSDGKFVPRYIERSCECRSCEFSRCSTDSSNSTTEPRSVQECEQSRATGEQLATGSEESGSNVGTGSMSSTRRRSTSPDRAGSSRGESSSESANRSSSSSTISNRMGSSTKSGSSNTSERICNTSTGSSRSLSTIRTGGTDGDSSGSDEGTSTGRRHYHAIYRSSSGKHKILSSVVSMGGSRSKKSKMGIQIQTEEQQLGGKMVSLTIPDKDEWCCYLSHLHYRFQDAPVSLHCVEQLLDSDSD